MFGWLDRVLGAIGIAVFLVGLWLMTRATLREWGSAVRSAWRERRASLRGRPFHHRLLITALAIVLLGAIIPRPITVTGSFVAAPARLIPLTSPDSGVVERVYARQGTWVAPGTPLVEIRDFDLERNLLAVQRRSDSLEARERQARAAGKPAEVARLEAEQAAEVARLDRSHRGP